MLQTQRSPIRPFLHGLIQLCYLRAILTLIPLKDHHLILNKLLSDTCLIHCFFIDKDLVGIVVGVIAGHLEALAFCSGAALDLGYQLADVLFHLNS